MRPYYAVLVGVISLTNAVIVDDFAPVFRSCCYGDETFQHGEVVLGLPRACLQLVCNDGRVERRYLGSPGEQGCCEFDGQLYPDGAELVAQCLSLTCSDTCWNPSHSIEDCCSHCVVFDDPHFITFDNHHFDFHGICNYSLAQSDSTHQPDIGIFSDYKKCFGDASCLSHTTFRNDPNTVLTLSNGAIWDVLVNGDLFMVTPGKVHTLKSSQGCHPVLAWRSPWGAQDSPCVTLLGSSRLMVQHCPHRLDVWAHPSHTDTLDGLCGHFNFHVDDDFTSRSGIVHPLSFWPLAFPTSWMTNMQSDAVCLSPCKGCNVDNTTDPCTATPAQRFSFREQCVTHLRRLISDKPHLHFHYDRCAFDLCILYHYQLGESEIGHWLRQVENIVELSVYVDDSTENKETTAATTQPPVTIY